MLELPLVMVAALQGHAFAAGAMLSLAHDVRVMRSDPGYWCLPESALGIAFTQGMAALIGARLAPRAAHEAMVTARRHGGEAALAAGIVDYAVDKEAVRATAVTIASDHTARAGNALGTTKTLLYGTVLTALRGSAEHRPRSSERSGRGGLFGTASRTGRLWLVMPVPVPVTAAVSSALYGPWAVGMPGPGRVRR